MLKFEGVFTLQTQGDGLVRLMVADLVERWMVRRGMTTRDRVANMSDKLPAALHLRKTAAPRTIAPRESLATRVVRGLGGEIARGVFKPGDRLPSEQALMSEFGVSRTVVREAISSLRADGLVATQQGRGAFVLQPGRADAFRVEQIDLATIEDVRQMLELRACVEAEAASLAAQRRTAPQLAALRRALERMAAAIARGESAVEADFDFHLRIAEATGNRHFPAFFRTVGTLLIPRSRVHTMGRDPGSQRGYLEGVNREHDEVYRAIAAREPDAARAAMRMHLTRSRNRHRARAGLSDK